MRAQTHFRGEEQEGVMEDGPGHVSATHLTFSPRSAYPERFTKAARAEWNTTGGLAL